MTRDRQESGCTSCLIRVELLKFESKLNKATEAIQWVTEGAKRSASIPAS